MLTRYLWIPVLLCSNALRANNEIPQAFELLTNNQYQEALDLAQRELDAFKLNVLEDILQAYIIIGVGHCHLGREAQALKEFEILKTFEPLANLNALDVSSRCLELFETMGIPKKIRFDPSPYIRAETALPNGAIKMTKPNRIPFNRHLPFGVGQFKNNQRKKGVAFLVSQSILLSAGLSFKGAHLSTDRPAFRDTGHALLGTGALISIWGMVDAVQTYRDMPMDHKGLKPNTLTQ